MTAIFLDTVGLVAMWNRADQWHEAAITAFELIKSKRAVLKEPPRERIIDA